MICKSIINDGDKTIEKEEKIPVNNAQAQYNQKYRSKGSIP